MGLVGSLHFNGINSSLYKNKLSKIFSKAGEMRDAGKIKKYGFVNDLTGELQLVGTIKLKFLYPTSKYYELYNRKAFRNDTTLNNNPDANYLSTVIKIFDDDWFILLTSDSTKEVFEELVTDKVKFKGIFLAGQVSHHGSKNNYVNNFWKTYNRKYKGKNAIISYGENDYGHPDQKVISNLQKEGFDIYLTMKKPSTSSSILSDLDFFSISTTESSIQQVGEDINCLIQNNSILIH